jgi:D-amino-acid dehydrogenase
VHIVVLGAGIIGTSTAYFLARHGHTVTVLDRHPTAAMETSFANGGQISPCHAEPWANETTIRTALKWLGRPGAPLQLNPLRWDPDLWRWMFKFLRNCTANRAAYNLSHALAIALYSRNQYLALADELGLDFDLRTAGILHFYRNRKSFVHAQKAARIMEHNGLQRHILSPADCSQHEPALAHVQPRLAGGIFTPGDASGDIYKFTQALAHEAEKHGVRFLYNQDIKKLEQNNGRITSAITHTAQINGDAFVVALGSFTSQFLKHLHLRLPIYPAKGYSITLHCPDDAIAPTVSLTDDENKMVYSRLGQRLRVAGTAEFVGYNTEITLKRAQVILQKTLDVFPHAGGESHPNYWAGLRPKTPDSVPIIGETPLQNLYINSGHGTLGWTMGLGSGRLLADYLSDQTPAIALDGYSLRRFIPF